MRIKETRSTKYLGEVISSDGTNTENVAARKRQGFGTVKEIVKMLDEMCLGPYLYQKPLLFRESLFVGNPFNM